MGKAQVFALRPDNSFTPKPLRGAAYSGVRHGQTMSQFVKTYLLLAGIAASAGAMLHIAILFGGPAWYAFFGAPEGLVAMARSGSIRAPISCLVIAAFLAVLAAYAFSGAGVTPRLPALRLGLASISAILILRGVLFVPLIVWRPGALSGICNCRSVDTFIVVTSALCLAMGVGYALGALAAPIDASKPKPLRGSA